MIENQVTLPVNVAFGVALQGMQIRFERSLVTVLGVALGIAFLMAMLTEQVVSEGVEGEERLRTEVRRMYSFLAAEMGPVASRVVGLVRTGELSATEQRFLLQLEDKGLQRLLWVDLTNGVSLDSVVAFRRITPGSVGVQDIGLEASAVIVAGSGTLTVDTYGAMATGLGSAVLCITRAELGAQLPAGVAISLERQLRDEEVTKIAEDRRKAEFRNTWIVIISLVVTVIGIGNAMLISVTERFREIATMKCLGALSRFIRLLFLIEATIMGLSGAAAGTVLGIAFTLVMYGLVYEWALVIGSVDLAVLIEYSALSLVAGVVLSVVAAIYPAHIASAMVPADALRSHV